MRSAPDARRFTFVWIAAAIGPLGCASAARPGTLYQTGMNAFHNDQMAQAADALAAFGEKVCWGPAPDKRCREAYVSLGHARERLGSPGGAWAAYDAALRFPPHTRDQAINADLDRIRGELADRNARRGEQGPMVILYKDEVSDEFSARSVVISVDFEPVVTKDKDASNLHSPDFRRVYGGLVSAGEHVVMVEAVHDCKPGSGVRCARSHLRKAWPFKSEPHTPTTIEIRAYAESGDGDLGARPALDFSAH
jgi:hypothetical protein